MTVWSALLTLALGIAIGAAGTILQLGAEAERRIALERRARLNVRGHHRTGPPRSNCRTLPAPYDQTKEADRG